MGRALFTIMLISLFMYGCGYQTSDNENGIYNGTFNVKYADGKELTTPITLILHDGKYHCKMDVNDLPGGGSGTYCLDGKKIRFKDLNYWTDEFDWGLILKGQYDFTIANNQQLTITSNKANFAQYQYILSKN